MPDIEFNCPQCQSTLVVAAEEAGLQGNCPQCRAKIIIPRSQQREFPVASTIRCPSCGGKVYGSALFCGSCGARLNTEESPTARDARLHKDARPYETSKRNCRYCGSVMGKDAVFCIQCGTDLRTGEQYASVVLEGQDEREPIGAKRPPVLHTLDYRAVGCVVLVAIAFIAFLLHGQSSRRQSSDSGSGEAPPSARQPSSTRHHSSKPNVASPAKDGNRSDAIAKVFQEHRESLKHDFNALRSRMDADPPTSQADFNYLMVEFKTLSGRARVGSDKDNIGEQCSEVIGYLTAQLRGIEEARRYRAAEEAQQQQQQQHEMQTERKAQIQNYIDTYYPRFVGGYASVREAAYVAQQKNAMLQGTMDAGREYAMRGGGGGVWEGPRVARYKYVFDGNLRCYVVYQE